MDSNGEIIIILRGRHNKFSQLTGNILFII